MGRIFIILFCCLFISSACIAEDDLRSKNLCNGRMWMELDKVSKIGYINAIHDFFEYHKERNIKIIFAKSGREQEFYSYVGLFYPIFLKGDEVVEQLDAFYSDSLNRSIPILVALRVVTQKSFNAPEDAINLMISEARRGEYVIFDEEK